MSATDYQLALARGDSISSAREAGYWQGYARSLEKRIMHLEKQIHDMRERAKREDLSAGKMGVIARRLFREAQTCPCPEHHQSIVDRNELNASAERESLKSVIERWGSPPEPAPQD